MTDAWSERMEDKVVATDEQRELVLKNAEINIFLKTPEGFKGHIKITELDYRRIAGTMEVVSQALLAKNFTPDAGLAGSRGDDGMAGVTPIPNPQTAPPPPCEYCGGAVWDNRKNKKNPKGPDFKCKDSECGGAAWLNKEGDLHWKEG